jgi:predicted NBD/HSP70 family sugar kinase
MMRSDRVISMSHESFRETPPSALSLREQNRLTVMELVFREAGIVRSVVETRTGLSRATIYRIVDELTGEGYLVESPTVGRRTRGRPKLELFVSPDQGHVVGVDIGVLTTRMMLSDLNAHVLARRRDITPPDLTARRLADWVAERIAELRNEARDFGPLRRAVISLPAKTDRDGTIARPAGHLKYLSDSDFLDLVAARIGASTDLRSDPDMALLGEMQIGRATGYRDVAMFVMSSSLSASVAIDGAILGGRRHVIGEFGSMPHGYGMVLRDVLTAPGVLTRAARHGVDASDVTNLLEVAPPDVIDLIRDDVRSGLLTAFAAITLSVDPEIIVVTGSMLPLISLELAATMDDLSRVLPGVPEVALSETGGYSQPRGAVEVALNHVRRELLNAVSAAAS